MKSIEDPYHSALKNLSIIIESSSLLLTQGWLTGYVVEKGATKFEGEANTLYTTETTNLKVRIPLFL